MAEIDKETMEFLTEFGGAAASVLEQLAFEWWWTNHPESRDQFPYTRPIPQAPMYYDFIVAGLAVAPWVAGILVEDDAKKRGDTKTQELAKNIREFGEGGVIYSAPMLVHVTAVRNTPVGPTTETKPASQSPPQQKTPTQGIVYKL